MKGGKEDETDAELLSATSILTVHPDKDYQKSVSCDAIVT
jgi:hypothetical protein